MRSIRRQDSENGHARSRLSAKCDINIYAADTNSVDIKTVCGKMAFFDKMARTAPPTSSMETRERHTLNVQQGGIFVSGMRLREPEVTNIMKKEPFSNLDMSSFPGATYQVLTQRPFVTAQLKQRASSELHRNQIVGGVRLSQVVPVIADALQAGKRAGLSSQKRKMTREKILSLISFVGRNEQPSGATTQAPLTIRMGGKVNFFCSLATPDGKPSNAESLGLAPNTPLYLTLPEATEKDGKLHFDSDEFMLCATDPTEIFKRSDELPLSPLATEVLHHARMCMTLFGPSSRGVLQKHAGDDRSLGDICVAACRCAAQFGKDAVIIDEDIETAFIAQVVGPMDEEASKIEDENELFTLVINVILTRLDFLSQNRGAFPQYVDILYDPAVFPVFEQLRATDGLAISQSIATSPQIRVGNVLDVLRAGFTCTVENNAERIAIQRLTYQAVEEIAGVLAAAAEDAVDEQFQRALIVYIGSSVGKTMIEYAKTLFDYSCNPRDPPFKWTVLLGPATSSAVRDEIAYKKPTYARSPLFVGHFQCPHADGSIEVRMQG